MKVSIIVATLNRRNLLDQCLRSLFDQTYRDFEVIVVDGGSTDGTGDLAQRFPIKLVRQAGTFQPSGLNYGIQRSKGDILVFIDDDIIAERDWLESLVENFRQSEICGVGGRVIIPGLTGVKAPATALSSYLKLRNSIFSSLCENRVGETGRILRSGYVTSNLDRLTKTGIEVQSFQGCNMAFRRSVFERVGLFDESFAPLAFRFETEFCIRAFARGFKLIYTPKATVYHQVHDAHGTWTKGVNLGRNLFYNSFNDFLFVVRRRKQIPRFSWIRFLLLQSFSAEECLRLAMRRKKLAYLRGPMGILAAFRNWISNSKDARTGHIPLLPSARESPSSHDAMSDA